MKDSERKKPPLGVRPQHIFAEELAYISEFDIEAVHKCYETRYREVIEAINRYASEGKKIPHEWGEEMTELAVILQGTVKTKVLKYLVHFLASGNKIALDPFDKAIEVAGISPDPKESVKISRGNLSMEAPSGAWKDLFELIGP